MKKQRIKETDIGIQGFDCKLFDKMQRKFRDRGWLETDSIIQSGINQGLALEIGPGPGYLGLEWLKKTNKTKLVGLEISKDMIEIAEKNIHSYDFSNKRVSYVHQNAKVMPFSDNYFNAVFSTGSLHEWDDAVKTFNEIYRVLKPGGKLFIGDLKRNMNPFTKGLAYLFCSSKEMRCGLISSINAAYIHAEAEKMLQKTDFNEYKITETIMGLKIIAKKG